MADSIDSDRIFDLVGGPVAVAKHFSLPVSTTGSWKARRRIPSERWLGFVEMARAAGKPEVTLEVLAKLHAALVPAKAGALS